MKSMVTLNALTAKRIPKPYEQFVGVSFTNVSLLSDITLTKIIAQDEQADRHDLFKTALVNSKDKFATISEWFGRGVMVSPPAVEG